jgi:peroxiredoxin
MQYGNIDVNFMRNLCFILIIVLVFFASADRGASVAYNAPEPGKHAPLFTLKDTQGKNVSLSDFKGKVVLINFWATWCGSCKAEMPSLNNLYRALKDKGFAILAISTDSSEIPVRYFVAERGISFPVLMDKDKMVYSDKYAVIGLPMSFLIDRDGVIVGRVVGEVEWDSPEMKNKITGVLNRK